MVDGRRSAAGFRGAIARGSAVRCGHTGVLDLDGVTGYPPRTFDSKRGLGYFDARVADYLACGIKRTRAARGSDCDVHAGSHVALRPLLPM